MYLWKYANPESHITHIHVLEISHLSCGPHHCSDKANAIELGTRLDFRSIIIY